MRLRLIIQPLFFVCVTMSTAALYGAPGMVDIYVINDTEKIKQADSTYEEQLGKVNSVWNGKSISLFGGRNEVIAFQLILRADQAGASDIQVVLDSVYNPKFSIKNPVSATLPNDITEKWISLYKETYINIMRRTDDASVWWSGAGPLQSYTGNVPDGLIPLESGSEKSRFDIQPLRNQAVWVDIYIPHQAPAGRYTGFIRVYEGAKPISETAIELNVLNFTLSDSTHFKNLFFASQKGIHDKHGVPYYSPEYYQIEAAYYKLAHQHRMNLSFNQTVDSFIVHAMKYYTGEAYTRDKGYEGPGSGVGNNVYGIGIYDQPNFGAVSGYGDTTAEGWQKASRRWAALFSKTLPEVSVFRYMIDEPDSNRYPIVRRRAAWISSKDHQRHILPTFCTVKIDPRLFGAIDIWGLAGQAGYDPGDGIRSGTVVKEIVDRHRVGEEVALYNGTRPAFGALSIIDTDGADARINPWIAWKYRIDFYFLWHVNYFFQGDRKINPWIDNYRLYGDRIQWGAGTLIYPGEDKEFPASDLGIPAPLPSIRMKIWRRGMQDYEYLWLADRAGLHSEVLHALHGVVPYALDECPDGQNAQPPWALRGETFEQTRLSLANALEMNNNYIGPLKK